MKRYLSTLLLVLGSAPALAMERFAIVIGNNEGQPSRQKLWFAEQDAEHLVGTLSELGEIWRDHTVLLRNGRVAQVRQAFRSMDQRVKETKAAGQRSMVLVYFSGHADSVGLELGNEQLTYEELRSLVTQSSADVKVAIVDACEAGLFTQAKGARAAPEVNFLLPGEETVEGVAFVASTAPGEAAQESAAIGGSFFTHHFEMALRGAGDADGDGRVTLAEAFRYASGQTVAGTFRTEVGPQHPTYALRMSGRGDVVLSDLRRGDAHLRLPANAQAQYIVRGPAGFIAEVKGTSRPINLALPKGDYTIERRGDGQRRFAQVSLSKGASRDLPELTAANYDDSRRKGGSAPFEVFAGPTLENAPLPDFGVAPGVRIGAGYQLFSWLNLRLRVDYTQKSVLTHYDYHGFRGTLTAMYPLLDTTLRIEAGPEVGFAQEVQILKAGGGRYSAGVPSAGMAAALSLPFGPVRIRMDGDVRLQRFALDNSPQIRPAANLALVTSYAF